MYVYIHIFIYQQIFDSLRIRKSRENVRSYKDGEGFGMHLVAGHKNQPKYSVTMLIIMRDPELEKLHPLTESPS